MSENSDTKAVQVDPSPVENPSNVIVTPAGTHLHPSGTVSSYPQKGSDGASVANSANMVTTSGAHEYNNYTAYASTADGYTYGAAYASYYNAYQHHPNQLYSQQQTSHLYPPPQPILSQVQQQPSSSDANQQPSHSFSQLQPTYPYNQPVGDNQNSGAPSSFQNTASYVGATSYSTTYYKPDDYQTSGGYANKGYNNQTAAWNNGKYGGYDPQLYANYSASAYNPNVSTSNVNTQHHYGQWADYYNQTEVTCAPGTENLSAASSSCQGSSGSAVPGGYSVTASHPSISHPHHWRPETYSSAFHVQPVTTSPVAHGNYWKVEAPSVQHHLSSPAETQYKNSLDKKPCYDSFQAKQNAAYVPNSQSTTAHQVSSNQQLPTPNLLPFDTPRVSKFQVPTNPRIVQSVDFGAPKFGKDGSTTVPLARPAYVAVSMPNSTQKSQPDVFPKSLRDYVVRAFNRCSDESQLAACQTIMKEIITNATADGTLSTRDWDAEALFPLPDPNSINKDNAQSALPATPYSVTRSKRTKSRWEPISENKAVENAIMVESSNNVFWNRKPPFGIQSPILKNPVASMEKPNKRQRQDNGVDKGGTSSDSDKEQSLTGYSAGAIALAANPEEKKRRESRSKRFEKVLGNKPEFELARAKVIAAGNLHSKRSNTVGQNKIYDDDTNEAVEDFDWDSLTVKGTCQEIEKRYLRLTSAPDPSAVRPEDVLEKALAMVKSSDKNYLYKCDQLKSIRQDLTVQRIRNHLTVKVYETHARFALEAGDLPEYNQCQSQLKILYGEGIEGCHMEFAAYNLLCVILHSNNRRDLLSAMSRLTAEAKEDEAVKHALAVRAAVTSGNYLMFFRLHKAAPNLNWCLLDLHVEKMRYKAVNCMARSYRPTVPVSYISKILGFESQDVPQCAQWLRAHGAVLVSDGAGELHFDSKASSSFLHMPEPEDAVAHGDANLALNDFFSRS